MLVTFPITSDLLLIIFVPLYLHVLNAKLVQTTISSTHNYIAIRQLA